MKTVRDVYVEFLKRPWLGYALVFSLTVAIYGLAQAHPSMRDPDSFYHARMAVLTMEHGPVRNFPWLPFTTLADDFADHHFLYHVLLIPFVTLWGPLAGAKVAAGLFGALAVTAVYWLMRVLHVRFPCVFALLLATLDSFMFRMNLAKTSSLSIIVLSVGIIAILKKRPWLLAPLAFVYVWTYAGWPLLIGVAASFLAAAWVARLLGRRSGGKFLSGDGEPVTVGTRALVASSLGSIAGIVMNPFFPANIKFYLAQIGHIALLNYSDVIDVGLEWYPYPFLELAGQNATLFLIAFLAAALAVGAVVWRKEAKSRLLPFRPCEATALIMFVLLTAVFLVLTLKSRRNIEYLIPFMMLLNATVFTAAYDRTDFRLLWEAAFGRFLILPRLLAVLFFILLPLLAVRDMNAVIDLHQRGIAWSYFEGAAGWMRDRVPEDAVIFHSRWSDFPVLFYRAPEFRYISGLDPTFMYLKDPALYDIYAAVREGKYGAETGGVVRQYFGSDHIIIRSGEDRALENALDSDPTLSRVYEDDEAVIYASL